LINEFKSKEYQVRLATQHMLSKQLNDEALKLYLAGRKSSGDESKYALELANAYRILDQKDDMIEEYLKFAALRPGNLRYVKNILQNILQDEEDVESFQSILIDKIQKNPMTPIYGDLLIWVNLQQQNFFGAFIQAKALDKRFKEEGNRLMEIGDLAIKNRAYEDAIKIFTYVVDKYPNGRNYSGARRQIIKTRESKVKNVYPIDTEAIRHLTNDYQKLIDELGINQNTLGALRGKALLHAFYLHEYDIAIKILNSIITRPRIDKRIKAMSKLDLGDIYLLIDQSWESTLLYSQVEKENKSSRIGYTAKLKNAKLNYYKGDFELSKSHLDILKKATTKEISNDAIALSLLIQDNTLMDSSDYVMKEYAQIDLLLFQNKPLVAKTQFNSMLVNYPSHSLVDEIHWKIADIELKKGDFRKALKHLEIIGKNYGTDIWGDDALFLMAEIYQNHLKEEGMAMELYREFLTTYPGSIFVSDARKRFRSLRGDEI